METTFFDFRTNKSTTGPNKTRRNFYCKTIINLTFQSGIDNIEVFLTKLVFVNLFTGLLVKTTALDVYATEPLDPKSELFDIKNVLMSPHISGNFSSYQEIMIKQFNDMLIKGWVAHILLHLHVLATKITVAFFYKMPFQ